MTTLRLAFVGQHAYFGYTSLQEEADGVEPRFFDFRHGAHFEPVREALEDYAPDVVFVWRPEIIPAGGLHGLPAARIGYLTEPLPRPGTPDPHPDLQQRLTYLEMTDPENFDRIACFDPLVVPTVERLMPVWRSFPIPVGDHYFGDVAEPNARPRILFTGRSTQHRESFLAPAKHDFDVIHLAHGVTDERLVQFLREVDVGLNLHNEPYPTFENRVQAYLAAGLLVITEPVSPTHGLLPGRDYVEVRTPWELHGALAQLERHPDAFRAIRVAGRRNAERFRASHVFPRLVRDVLAATVT